jgi:predicted anti-sigma-YlaC factor YlaD
MTTISNNNKFSKWLPYIFGTGLLISFFLPWVSWDGNSVSGYDMPGGNFFSLSETKFGLGNPFPELSFAFNIFWLIPALSLLVAVLIFLHKKTVWPAFITGVLSLSLLTIFFLFTKQDLAVETNSFHVLKTGGYIAAISAIGLILTTIPSPAWYTKAGLIILGPLFAFCTHMIIEKKIMGETHKDTKSVKSDYTITAIDLIHEFAENDSAANKKYREKIVSVNGAASDVETKSDSTVNIKFTDSTGSYIIFSLDKSQYDKVKNIKPGDAVSLKGSCSGSVYSDILSTTAISFKRSILNKQ